MTYPDLTPDQAATLDAYIAYHGRQWKSKLLEDWRTGRAASFVQGHHLQQLRNTHGPRWLREYK